MDEFGSLLEVVTYFDTEDKCLTYLAKQRWEDKVSCPHCENKKVYSFSDGKRYKCAKCRQLFNAKTNTIFEDTKISMRKWYVAIYLVLSHKKGISSHQLGRDLKVTQRTAWFILHRIRFGLGLGNDDEPMGGEHEISLDESFVGGKNKNRHHDKKVENSQGRSFKDKTPVMGILEEAQKEYIMRPHKVIAGKTVRENIVVKESRVFCQVVPDTKASSLQPIIFKQVIPGSKVVSDEWHAYRGLETVYEHVVIDHRAKEYVNAAGDTTNSLEGFWTWLKRAYIGIYHWMSRKHLNKYVAEVVFRYNTKHLAECHRFRLAFASFNNRITYKSLIS